jgi:hypothetical protein
MDLSKFDNYINSKKNVDESSNEKKEQMYKEGAYSLRHSFNDFSQYYMKAMGLMQQGKGVMDPKFKKLRNSISAAYERMDDAISKHMDTLIKDAEVKRG